MMLHGLLLHSNLTDLESHNTIKDVPDTLDAMFSQSTQMEGPVVAASSRLPGVVRSFLLDAEHTQLAALQSVADHRQPDLSPSSAPSIRHVRALCAFSLPVLRFLLERSSIPKPSSFRTCQRLPLICTSFSSRSLSRPASRELTP